MSTNAARRRRRGAYFTYEPCEFAIALDRCVWMIVQQPQFGDRRWFMNCPSDACPEWVAGSTGRRNTGVKFLCRGFKSQGLAWPLIELAGHFVEMGLRVHRQVGSFRKILSQQAIGVLVGTALP